MTLAQLIDFTKTFLRADGVTEIPSDGHLIDLLNQSQLETVSQARTPTRFTKFTSTTPPFNLPAAAIDDDGILSVTYSSSGSDDAYAIDKYSVERANSEYPEWLTDTNTADPIFFVYEPAVLSKEDIHVYPNPGSKTWWVHYVEKPADMRALDDSPFAGEHPRFHIMLAHHVVYQFSGSGDRLALWMRYLGQMIGSRRRGGRSGKNPMYKMRGPYYSGRRSPSA